MADKILEALIKSEKHWKDNVNARSTRQASLDWEDCALCQIFYANGCLGCPVKEKTGLELCKKTPYIKALDALVAWGTYSLSFYAKDAKKKWKAAAQAELDFLHGLRMEREAAVEEESCRDCASEKVDAKVEECVARSVDPNYDGSYF